MSRTVAGGNSTSGLSLRLLAAASAAPQTFTAQTSSVTAAADSNCTTGSAAAAAATSRNDSEKFTSNSSSNTEPINRTECIGSADLDDVIDTSMTSSKCGKVADRQACDIDGLPLSGKRKLNLKLLLSQGSIDNATDENDDDENDRKPSSDDAVFDSVTDEDWNQQPQNEAVLKEEGFKLEDYEFPEEDDDAERRQRKLSRKSSLRSVKSEDGVYSPDATSSPHNVVSSPGVSGCKKFVKFADSIGMGLEDVRALLNQNEPPMIPCSALRDLNMRRRRTKTEGLFTLSLDFEPPGVRPDFILVLLEQKVLLENCIVGDSELSIYGVIRVCNLSYNKRVFIRYTTNCWLTENDVLSAFVPDSSDGTSERFMFNVGLPDGFGLADARLGKSSRVEFAVCFCAGDVTYWDNNRGANYVVSCHLLNPEKTAIC